MVKRAVTDSGQCSLNFNSTASLPDNNDELTTGNFFFIKKSCPMNTPELYSAGVLSLLKLGVQHGTQSSPWNSKSVLSWSVCKTF